MMALTALLAGPLSLAARVPDSETREMARLPEAPADHVLDVGELFGRHPERRKEISRRLVQLEVDHDLPVYLVIYSGLIDSDVSRRARLFYEKWIGSGRDGVVMVYDTDTLEREIVCPNPAFKLMEGEAEEPPRLEDFQMIPIRAELDASLNGLDNRIEHVDRASEILAARLDALMRADPSGLADRSLLKFVIAVLAFGILALLLGVFAHRRMQAAEGRARERFYFPDVTVGVRLGAPFCGGRQSVVDYSKRGPARR